MKEHGMTGKRNAAKPDDDKADSHLHIRVTRSQKAHYVREAQNNGMKLSEWVTRVLDENSKDAFD